MNNNFPIIGVTENWLKPHNVDSYFIEGYTHEYDLRPMRPGGGVSLFIADSLTVETISISILSSTVLR